MIIPVNFASASIEQITIQNHRGVYTLLESEIEMISTPFEKSGFGASGQERSKSIPSHYIYYLDFNLKVGDVIQWMVDVEGGSSSLNVYITNQRNGVILSDGSCTPSCIEKFGAPESGIYRFAFENYTLQPTNLVFFFDHVTGGKGGGCLIATAAFGSEMAPQVQFLRELRDNTVLQTESGTSFMTGFNQFYYSFSPTIADYERENPAFKEAVKLTLTPLLTSLTLLQYADIDSESEMLGYGIGIILLNIGMYFVAPAVLIMKIKKRI